MKKRVIGIQGPLCAFLVCLSWEAQTGAEGKLSFQEEPTNVVHLDREKRQIIYPNASLLQLIAGVTVPTPSKDIRCNWAFQANFDLPWNRTQIPTDIFLANSGYDGDSRVIKEKREIKDESIEDKERLYSKTRRRDKTQHDEGTNNITDIKDQERQISDEDARHVRNEEIGTDLYGLFKSESRLLHLYQGIEKMLGSFGYEGSPCVLRTLCQLAKEPLVTDHDEDLLHELASFVLDPNNDLDDFEGNEEDHAYLKAFARGRAFNDCTTHYSGCSLDIVNIITTLKHD